ncbi:hypothetical protein AAHE18_10G161400 [Arachis hypogaea]
MIKRFKMTDIDLMSFFLGIEKKYANDILKKFHMKNSKSVPIPVEEKFKLLREEDKERSVNFTYYKSLIRSLRYMTATRLDFVFGVGLLNKLMEKSYTNHLQAVKQISQYIRGTLNNDIYYENTNKVNIVGYTDTIVLCKNSIFHGRSKHINIQFHKIREFVNEKKIVIEYCLTEKQVTDIFTKSLKIELFYKLKKMFEMINSKI